MNLVKIVFYAASLAWWVSGLARLASIEVGQNEENG